MAYCEDALDPGPHAGISTHTPSVLTLTDHSAGRMSACSAQELVLLAQQLKDSDPNLLLDALECLRPLLASMVDNKQSGQQLAPVLANAVPQFVPRLLKLAKDSSAATLHRLARLQCLLRVCFCASMTVGDALSETQLQRLVCLVAEVLAWPAAKQPAEPELWDSLTSEFIWNCVRLLIFRHEVIDALLAWLLPQAHG